MSALAALAALIIPATSAAGATLNPAVTGATAASARPVLTVSGTVADPVSYTMSQLSALPSETVSLPVGGHTVQATGVSLDSLVTLASPVLPSTKNALLRVLVTAGGPLGHPVTFALGELDPGSATMTRCWY
jgi:hypothetical protein